MSPKRKPRVLIADDEAHVRALIKRIVLSLGFELAGEVSNGKDAVEIFRAVQPDLLLLDINMPLKTGYDALKEIMDEFPRALVIMLTSVADYESVEACLGYGAANYILKDNPIRKIREIIHGTLVERLKKAGKDDG